MNYPTQDVGAVGTDVFTAYVHVTDEAGLSHAFGPGDPIPGWASPLVGDHVRARSTTYTPVVPDAPPATALEEIERALGEPPVHVPAPDTFGEKPFPPPVKGPGSGQQAWYQWAEQVGAVAEFGITRSWTRQDIQDALIRGGHLTEPD